MEAEESQKTSTHVNIVNPFGFAFPFGVQQFEAMKNKKDDEKDAKKKKQEEKISVDLSDTDRATKKQHITNRDEEELSTMRITYPLTPANPKENEQVFSWGEIKWNNKDKHMEYIVHEPKITKIDESNLKKIRKIIEEKLNIHFETSHKKDAITYLKNMLNDIIVNFGLSIRKDQLTIYEYYLLRDFIGLGKLQPIMNDGNIEDVSCDGIGVPIFVYHRNPKLGSMKTNVVFDTKDDLDDFTMRLSQKCEKSISIAEPLLDGALTDGSRVHATLGSDVARRGSNFTIRKFTNEPLTPLHLLRFGTLDEKMLAYLWIAIENNASILVSGPTAAGKTSLLNALSLFIKQDLKIISIEDTPELRLPHPHWVPEVSRSGFGITGSGKRIGEVSMFDLLKGSLRQRPDYIIVGEVRGEEAYVLFQQMATGHAGLSTIHADSIEKVIDRLTTKPINLPASLLETLDLVVFTNRIKYKNKYIRRVMAIQEIGDYDSEKKKINSSRIFKWKSNTDKFEPDEKSDFLGKITEKTGMTAEDIKDEINNRMIVLKWMHKNNITKYTEVDQILSSYSADKERFLEKINYNE
ncbi:MAG: type II/IV secretion system ATPase subunit [Candidatus Aenigmarchaeota archaeon]|nr:type II/IV secretion system ATPase subunit [Candidatus Aenigmarchaeota archaeon]